MFSTDIMKRSSALILTFSIALMVILLLAASAAAATSDTTDLSQQIQAGGLDTEIRDASRAAVASPLVTFPSTFPPFTCETKSATLGTDSERIYVDNGDAADTGWTLDIAATSGITATWSDGGTNTYDFNNPAGSGCTAGQMTIDATTSSTITPDCDTCTTTGITTGTSTSFDEGVTDSANLITAAGTSDDVGRWYIEGIDVDQVIPAGQNAGTYTLDMTITVTAQ